MEAVQTFETLVNSYQCTRRYNPEDGHLHTHRRDNLKSYLEVFCSGKPEKQHISSTKSEPDFGTGSSFSRLSLKMYESGKLHFFGVNSYDFVYLACLDSHLLRTVPWTNCETSRCTADCP
jgi:hypothetical protein